MGRRILARLSPKKSNQERTKRCRLIHYLHASIRMHPRIRDSDWTCADESDRGGKEKKWSGSFAQY